MYNHFIFDIKVKNLILNDVENIFNMLTKLLNLNVVEKWKHIFGNGGFTVFWLLSESHLSAHYRIEDNYLALDIYCCKDLENFEKEICDVIGKLGNFKVIKINREF